MSDLFGAAAIFILSFLGLVMVVILIFVLYLAYRYDISFSIRTRGKAAVKDPAAVQAPAPGNNDSVS